MKIFKRYITVILSMLIAVQIIIFNPAIHAPVNSFAEEFTEVNKNIDTNLNDNDSDQLDFKSYHSANSAVDYSGNDIATKASEYTTEAGADTSIADYIGIENAVLWTNESGKLEWGITVPQTGYYRLGIEYLAMIEKVNEIEVAVYINDEIQYKEAAGIVLPRLWINKGEVRIDALGNELSPVQVQEAKWQIEWLKDTNGLNVKPLTFLLKEGENTISVEMISGMIGMNRLILGAETTTENYDKVSESYTEYEYYDGDPIFIEGETAIYKSTKALRPMSDRSDPSVTPSDVYKQKINYIGSYNWKRPGEKLTWNITVPKSGLYELSFKYKQSYLRNGSSIRKLTIDGISPFAELENINFMYDLNWKVLTVGKKNPQLVYLTQGKHELSMEVSLGEIADVSRRLENLVFNIGEMYRKIVMITGSEPDINRDYRLYDQIPSLLEDLKSFEDELVGIADEMDNLSVGKGGSEAIVLRNLAGVMERMLRSKFRIHEYVKDYFTNYGSVSAWLYEMRNMPLDIDSIILSAPGKPLTGVTSGLMERFVYSVQKFFTSFIADYNTISVNSENLQKITLWLGWGREQAQVLDSMVKEQFSYDSNISVDIKLVNASLIQAILSGNAPDCSLMLSRGQPVNLAMRNALVDLSSFDDYDEVIGQFSNGATIPYQYHGKTYGLPDTQQFFMMFCRDDILKKLGLSIPKTWDELISCASVIMRNNMQVGIPYTQITDMNQTETGIGSMNIFPALLYQYGSSLYSDDLTTTQLMSSESVQAFTFWTSIYSKYKFPVSYDFYNRFRTGEMPIALANYTEYSRLMAAAPEIRGRWSIRQVPGRILNGELNNTITGGGTASVILKTSKNPEAAWEFLKWWTGEEAQYRYGSEIESILGIAARHPTSNLAAFSKQDWKLSDYNELMAQWTSVKEVPEVPGGYFTQRAIDNAFWNTVYLYQNPRDILLKWGKTVDEEIARKTQEYSNISK